MCPLFGSFTVTATAHCGNENVGGAMQLRLRGAQITTYNCEFQRAQLTNESCGVLFVAFCCKSLPYVVS